MTNPRLRVGVDLRCVESGDIRGLSRYTHSLTAALAERADVDLVGYCTASGAVDAPFDVEPMRAGSEAWSEQVSLPTWAHRRGIDVLWCPANRGLPLLAPVPTVLTLHDAVEWDASLVLPSRGRSRARFAYASVCSLASAARIIVPSEAARRAITERLRIAPERMSVIHEAADPKFHRPPSTAEIEATLGRHGLARGYVLYVGGLDPKKDVATLLRAAARRASAGHVTVVAGAVDGAWGTLAGSAGAAPIVRIEGPTDDEIRCLYAAAGCFVFPAIAEGFGLPVLEAMAAGVPVVGADAGALPEVIGSGGQLFRPGDDQELAGLISALLSDDALRDGWARRAAARASAMSWARAAEATMLVFREAAAMRRWGMFSNRAVRLWSWRAWMPPRPGRPDS